MVKICACPSCCATPEVDGEICEACYAAKCAAYGDGICRRTDLDDSVCDSCQEKN